MTKATVRMYRQGLGDCFLVTFENGSTTKRMLVDCGVILGTEGASTKMGDVVADIAKTTAKDIDIVVATHEHWDHLSGFVQAKDAFEELHFGEIWFAWTESPDDEQAARLRRDRSRRKAALKVALAHWQAKTGAVADDGDPFGVATRQRTAEGLLGFFGEALGAASTSDAMGYLASRKERKRYLEPGKSFAFPDLPGVRVFVLGPPRDEGFIKKTLPSKRDPETYDTSLGTTAAFAAAIAAQPDQQPTADTDPTIHPFDAPYRLELKGSESTAAYFDGEAAWRRIDTDWLNATTDLAIALDNDTNNTSLVLAIELSEGGDVLLFPGDAQVGNWLSWEDMEFRVPQRGNVTTADLLSRVVFYKVGHHASHNATLREKGLERMTHEGLHAMVPVDSEMALRKRWGQMPFKPLLARLEEKTRGRVIRSDTGMPKSLPNLDAKEKARFTKTPVQDLYIDLTFE